MMAKNKPILGRNYPRGLYDKDIYCINAAIIDLPKENSYFFGGIGFLQMFYRGKISAHCHIRQDGVQEIWM